MVGPSLKDGLKCVLVINGGQSVMISGSLISPLNAQVACRQLGFSNQGTTSGKLANTVCSEHKSY